MKSKNISIKIVTVFILLILLTTAAASACTGVYVGKEVSEDGSTILARTDDCSITTEIASCQVYDRIENTPGRMIQASNGFTWELPATTYKYTGIPDIPANGTGMNWDCGSTNEYGLMVTATVTGYTPKSVLKTDPFVKTGIGEESITQVLAQSSKTAKEAIQLLAKIIDEKGSSEANIVMVADQNEAWYMEIYTGHQYAAVKMPADKVAVFGNEFVLGTLDDYEDKILSPNLISHAENNGFAKYTDGSLNLFETYAGGTDFLTDPNHMRTWYGHKVFSPSTIGDYQKNVYYPLFYTPDKKIAVRDVMDLFRSRYQGTPYDVSTGSYRTIATEKASNAHIMELFDNLPPEMSVVSWFTLSEASYAPFIPFSNMVTAFDPHYSYVQDTYNYDEYSAYSQFKRLNTLAASRDRDIYGSGIRQYWEETEDYYLTVMPELLKSAAGINQKSSVRAQEYLTNAALSFEFGAYSDAQRLFDDLMWYMSENYISINQKDPVTGEYGDTPVVVEPFEASFDVAEFGKRLGYDVSVDSTGTMHLVKGATKISVTPSNGLKGSLGTLSVNGETTEVKVSTVDGKIFLPLSSLGVLKDNSTYRYVLEEMPAQAKTPVPVLGILAGIGLAALILRRK